MPKRIYIGSVSLTTTSATINTTFAPYGTIVHAAINLDPAGGPDGSANVEYTTAEAGTDAINARDRTTLDGSVIRVVPAR